MSIASRTAHRLAASQIDDVGFASAALDASFDGVMQIDREGRVRRLNAAAVALIDTATIDVAVGGRWVDLWATIDQDGARRALSRGLQGFASQFSGLWPSAGRAPRWLDVRMSPVLTATGRVAGLVAICRDITDVAAAKAAEARAAATDHPVTALKVSEARLLATVKGLERARDEAKAANAAKSAFLANMSHEIRTPLNGVIALADVLSRTPLDAAQQEMVATIANSGANLSRLLTDVLDLSRMESGQLQLDAEPFDLHEAVAAAAALAQVKARDKGLSFRLDVAPAARQTVIGDQHRLKQVLFNLLSNAVKFTQAGEVALMVAAQADAGGRLGFTCVVSDTGIGLKAKERRRIFNRFEQADSSVTRRFGGMGLGLAIVRELTHHMGGAIDVDSTYGRGSIFTLTLALPLAADTSHQPTLSPGLRVLSAEDHPTNRRVVELVLGAAGVDLTSVENGLLAVEASKTQVYDVILMDVQMPVMDGLEAIRRIRCMEAAAGRHTPIICLTANAMPEQVEDCRKAGADYHVAKPVVAQQLLCAIQTALADPQQCGGKRRA